MTKPMPMDEQKKSVIWREWERGTPMANIARVIDKPPATVFSYLQYHGGIRPRQRFRRTDALSLEEREEISRGENPADLGGFLQQDQRIDTIEQALSQAEELAPDAATLKKAKKVQRNLARYSGLKPTV